MDINYINAHHIHSIYIMWYICTHPFLMLKNNFIKSLKEILRAHKLEILAGSCPEESEKKEKRACCLLS